MTRRTDSTLIRVDRATHEILSAISYDQQRPMNRQLRIILYEWCVANGYDVPARLQPDPDLIWGDDG